MEIPREVELLDEKTYVIFLEVPGSKVVNLQAIFECYEGVAVVRTVSIKDSLITALTTPDMVYDCLSILNALKDELGFRIIARPKGTDIESYVGYSRKGIC